MNSIGGKSISVQSTPTITATNYTAGMQVGGVNALSQVALAEGRITTLAGLTFSEKATNAGAITYNVWFFDRLVTLSSTDHTTLAISQANGLFVVGKVVVDSCFFAKPGGTAGYAIASMSIPASAFPLVCNSTLKNLYYVLEIAPSNTTLPTYAATTDISLRFVFNQDF